MAGGPLRAIGVYGVIVAIAIVAGIAATCAKVPHVLIAAIVPVAAAYALVGVALLRRRL